MSEDVAGSRTPQEEAVAEEIEHTRQQLGETVEALAAKADVKERAQRRATEVTGNLRGKARAAKDKVTEQVGELRDKAAAKAAQAKDTAQAKVTQARDTAENGSAPVASQVAGRVAATARGVREITPAAQRSAGQAVATVREHRGKVAVTVAVLVLAWLAVRRLRK
jgi:dsDNA-specific endonuclease/ATPase MutS2